MYTVQCSRIVRQEKKRVDFDVERVEGTIPQGSTAQIEVVKVLRCELQKKKLYAQVLWKNPCVFDTFKKELFKNIRAIFQLLLICGKCRLAVTTLPRDKLAGTDKQ